MKQIGLFLRLFGWFTVRNLVRHRWRALVVLLGIALGAAVFTSVRLAVQASLDSFTQSIHLIGGQADWVVLRPGGRVPEELVPRLWRHPAVADVSPLIITYVEAASDAVPGNATADPTSEAATEPPSEVATANRPDPFLLIGLAPLMDRPFRSWEMPSAMAIQAVDAAPWLDLLREPFTLIAGRRMADQYQIAPGDRLTLQHVTGRRAFRVLGVLAPEGLALVDGGRVALTDLATAQEFTGLMGMLDRIDLRLKPAASSSDVDSLKAMLPPGIVLERPSENLETGRNLIRAYQLNLSVLSFVSLFVGMFLVYSLVALNAATRRHELAVLRSLGTSRAMLFALFIAEGGLFGLVGWVAALPLATVMVKHLLAQVSATISTLFVTVHADRLHLDPVEVAVSFGVTLIVATIAALQPAHQAMQVLPREALMTHGAGPETQRLSRPLAWLGLALTGLAWPVSKLPPVAGIPLPGYGAVFMLFLGFSLLSPRFLHYMGAFLPRLLRRLAGQPAYLAGRYIRDAGTRTAVSVGALITAMALFVALVIMIHSFRTTVELWVNQTISGDLFIRPQTAGINNYRDPLPQEVTAWLEHLAASGRAAVAPMHRFHLVHQGTPYALECVNFDLLGSRVRLLFLQGGGARMMQQLARGEGVIVSEVFANRTGLGMGRRYRVRVENLELDLPILGVFRDYRTQGGAVLYSLPHYMSQTGDHSWSAARLYLPKTSDNPKEDARRLRTEALHRFGRQYGLELTVGDDLRKAILRIFDETFTVTTVLLLIALVVAALGITTTLVVLVLERSRQLHTLVAVGASPGQLRSMVFWEALLMVTAGQCLGLICGFYLSHLLIYVINLHSFGWTFVYSVDRGALLGSLPLILATALVAAVPAAQLVLARSSAQALRE